MLYLYAICETGVSPPAAVRGIGGVPLDFVALGPVTLAVGRAPCPVEADLATLRRHQAVLEALMTGGPVLPFRFGTVVPDLNDIAAAVWSNLAAIVANLDDVAGCVELGLTGGMPRRVAQADPAAETGRDYLLRRCRHDAARSAQARLLRAGLDRLDRELHDLSRSSCRLPEAESGGLLRFAYLVPSDTVPEFQSVVRRATEDGVAPLLVASGPWPPYSFVRPDLLFPPPPGIRR